MCLSKWFGFVRTALIRMWGNKEFETRASYIICRAPCTMKMKDLLFKKQEKVPSKVLCFFHGISLDLSYFFFFLTPCYLGTGIPAGWVLTLTDIHGLAPWLSSWEDTAYQLPDCWSHHPPNWSMYPARCGEDSFLISLASSPNHSGQMTPKILQPLHQNTLSTECGWVRGSLLSSHPPSKHGSHHGLPWNCHCAEVLA